MRQEYHKLVRDRIPEIIRASGRECAVVIMSEAEYRQALLEKLVEEAQEAVQAGPQGLVRELADLYEVLDAVLAAHRIERETVWKEQEQRRIERGGFQERLRLLWTE